MTAFFVPAGTRWRWTSRTSPLCCIIFSCRSWPVKIFGSAHFCDSKIGQFFSQPDPGVLRTQLSGSCVRKPFGEWSLPPDHDLVVFSGLSEPQSGRIEILKFSKIFEFLPSLIYVKDNFQKVRLFRTKMLLQGTFQKVRHVLGQKCSKMAQERQKKLAAAEKVGT